MPRIRSVHPGQWRDEDFVECSPLARLLAIALRNEADDHGIFEWKPKTLKMNLLPADNADMDGLLAELESHNIIKGFEHEGRRFGAIRNFMEYQRPKKPNFVHFMPTEFRTYVASKTKSSEPEPPDKGSGSPKGENGSAEEGGRRKEEFPPTPPGDGFEAWYAAYPRHEGRGQAVKAYRSALKKTDPVTLLAGAKAAAERYAETEKRFIPLPATWLNGERWLDEDAPAEKPEDRGAGKLGSELTDEERLAQENYIRGKNGKPPKDAEGRILWDSPPVTEMPAHMRALANGLGDQSRLDIPPDLDRRTAKGGR